jgi:DNA-binding MarR family transcriptional regulator
VSEIGVQVVDYYRLGLRPSDIAQRLQVAPATVHYHLRKLKKNPAAQEAEPPSEKRWASKRTRELVAVLLTKG